MAQEPRFSREKWNPGAVQWAWPAKGAVDDVRIYKKALSDAEVDALFKAGGK